MKSEYLSMMGLFAIVAVVLGVISGAINNSDEEFHTYVPENQVSAEWRYQQLPMVKCAWCGKTGKDANLNRHHILPQSAMPELANDPTNLVVLCRACHTSVAHHNNFKKFEKNLMQIIEMSEVINSKEYNEQNH